MDCANFDFTCGFGLFYWTGILSNINRTENKTRWTCSIFASRLLWFLWHVLGTGVCAWIRMNSSDTGCSDTEGYANITTANNVSVTTPATQEDTTASVLDLGISLLNIYLYITCTLLLLACLGPIQGNIIKRNWEYFPKVLEKLKELEEMRMGGSEISEEDDTQELLQNSDSDLEAENVQIKKSKKENCCYMCYSNNILPKISVGIFVVLTIGFGSAAAYKAHDYRDLGDEFKLFAILFFLPLPMLTTIFVFTLIKKITKLYKILLDMKDEMFTVSKNLEKVSKYVGLLQETFEIVTSKIISFTIGINLVIFVTSSVLCSYEIVEGIKKANSVNNHLLVSHNFAEVDYFIPLSICYGFMFWICRVSDRLMSNIHVKIRLRIRLLLQKLYLISRKQDEPFKELEFIYKTLKEWPPQVYVYGGWKVNYQLFSAIILFIFTYSMKFYSFDTTKPHCRMV